MADAQGQTPENRRYADPFTTMTAGFTAPIRADGHCDDEPCPQSAQDISSRGTPLASRPERAAANNRRYGGGSEDSHPTIPDPCG